MAEATIIPYRGKGEEITREEAIEWFTILKEKFVNTAYEEYLEMAIKALKPCENAISRQAAIFLADELKQDIPDDERIADMVMAHNEGILDYQTKLSLLPPANPQQDTVPFDFDLYEAGLMDMPKEIIEVLDKIKNEIDQKQYEFMSDGDYNEGIRFGLMLAYQIIDKYKAKTE